MIRRRPRMPGMWISARIALEGAAVPNIADNLDLGRLRRGRRDAQRPDRPHDQWNDEAPDCPIVVPAGLGYLFCFFRVYKRQALAALIPEAKKIGFGLVFFGMEVGVTDCLPHGRVIW